MTRRNGGHPGRGAVSLDSESVKARAMLQTRRRRWCDGCQEEHEEVRCDTCVHPDGRPVWHLEE